MARSMHMANLPGVGLLFLDRSNPRERRLLWFKETRLAEKDFSKWRLNDFFNGDFFHSMLCIFTRQC